MPLVTDQAGRTIDIPQRIERVVSLVPSQSELICHLGAEERLVGITTFCIHPERVYNTRARVGGTKNFKLERVDALKPDLIVANKEENPKDLIDALSGKYPVWVSDVNDIGSALQMIKSVGDLLQCSDQASRLVADIADGWSRMGAFQQMKPKAQGLYLIWKKPYMAAGTDTFISSIMSSMGIDNCLLHWGERGLRYPRISIQDMEQLNPDFIFLSSEPYPFAESDTHELHPLCRKAALRVDGEAFSWFGSRMLASVPYLHSLALKLGA